MLVLSSGFLTKLPVAALYGADCYTGRTARSYQGSGRKRLTQLGVFIVGEGLRNITTSVSQNNQFTANIRTENLLNIGKDYYH
jgi:hypothetical protein